MTLYDLRVNEFIKRTIAEQGSKIGQVTFVKADGSERVLTFQNAAMVKHLVNSARGKRQAATRKITNPDQVIVCDIHALRAAQRLARDTGQPLKVTFIKSLQCARVLSLRVSKKTHVLRDAIAVEPTDK